MLTRILCLITVKKKKTTGHLFRLLCCSLAVHCFYQLRKKFLLAKPVVPPVELTINIWLKKIFLPEFMQSSCYHQVSLEQLWFLYCPIHCSSVLKDFEKKNSFCELFFFTCTMTCNLLCKSITPVTCIWVVAKLVHSKGLYKCYTKIVIYVLWW